MTKILKPPDDADALRAASEAAAALRAGKLVGFATETVYGIAALATDAGAMARLREIKDRPSRRSACTSGGARTCSAACEKATCPRWRGG